MKTNFITFQGYRKVYDHNVTLLLNKKAIEQKTYVKYLGVLIDEHLNWKEQISQITKKISRSVGIICKLRNCMDVPLLRTIYYSLVYSHLNYGIQVWGSACKTDLEKILNFQKTAVRAMSGHRWYQTYGNPGPLTPSDPLLKSLGILKIHDVYKLNVGLYMYDHDIPAQFIRSHDYSTRGSNDLRPQSARLTLTLNSISVNGPNIWNTIPLDIKKILRLVILSSSSTKGIYYLFIPTVKHD